MQNKKLRQSFEELTDTVAALGQSTQQLDTFANQVQMRLAQVGEVLGAVVSILGEKLVQGEVDRMRAERQAAIEATQLDQVKKLVEQKILVPTETSNEKSFIVGTDTFKAGDQPARRVQFEVAGLGNEDRKKYVGLKSGGTVENDRVLMTVSEVYDIDAARAQEVAEEQQREAAKKAAEIEAAKKAAEDHQREVEVVCNDAGAAGSPPPTDPTPA